MKTYYIYYTLGKRSVCKLDLASHEQEALNKVKRFLDKDPQPQTKTVTIIEVIK